MRRIAFAISGIIFSCAHSVEGPAGSLKRTTEENALFALLPTRRVAPTTSTRITSKFPLRLRCLEHVDRADKRCVGVTSGTRYTHQTSDPSGPSKLVARLAAAGG